MLNKIKKSLKMSTFVRVGILIAIFTLSFLAHSTTSYAQYYQVNNNGNISTYTDSNSDVNITTTNATNITGNTAVINAWVNGNNLYNTYNLETWFQYGTTTNLEYSSLHKPSNSGYANYSATISGLTPNTVYYFRAVAQTPRGVLYGITNSFRTDFASTTNTSTNVSNPVVLTAITQPTGTVGDDTVELNSLILNPLNDISTNAWFEYGTSLDLNKKTATVLIGTLPSAKHVNTLTGLSSGTTYYFRAVAQNFSGKSNGAILSFTTSGTKQVVATVTIPAVTKDTSQPNNTSTVTGINSSDTVTPSPLSANVVGSRSIFPSTLLGWLILLILILILIFLTKHFYNQRSVPQEHLSH